MSDKDQEVEISQYLRREQMGYFFNNTYVFSQFICNYFYMLIPSQKLVYINSQELCAGNLSCYFHQLFLSKSVIVPSFVR